MKYKLPLEDWLYNKYHIWRYDIPSRVAMQYAYCWGVDEKLRPLDFNSPIYDKKIRKYQICDLYAFGNYKIADIANYYGLTRTRVIAIIWRVYVDYNRRFKTKPSNVFRLISKTDQSEE